MSVMKLLRTLMFVGLLVGWPLSGPVVAQGLLTEPQGTIAPGTKITMQNWQQYKRFMADGMVGLFEGKYSYKMPKDVEIDVGPPIHIVAPSTFRQATEKYSRQVRVVHLPNGHNDVANYYAGEPFPDPSGPDKGYKILADLWYTYSAHLTAGMPDFGSMWAAWSIDRFGNYSKAQWAYVFRQLAFNTDPGVPRMDRRAAGTFYAQWLMVEAPEQAKYTAVLEMLPQDNQKPFDSYVFAPALRRSMRLSVSARCAPLLGTDWTLDDNKPGFDGGLAIFDADYLGDAKVLTLVSMTTAEDRFPDNYYMPLAFPKPSWGTWSLRDAWVINVHRIPSEAPGYCYSKRIIYVDKETARELWNTIYDSTGSLWKIYMDAYHPRKVPGTDGETIFGRFFAIGWDLQNDHISLGYEDGSNFGDMIGMNSEVPKGYDDVSLYSSPGGLMHIMR
jgi:Protein of unknown function (DUF1329)